MADLSQRSRDLQRIIEMLSLTEGLDRCNHSQKFVEAISSRAMGLNTHWHLILLGGLRALENENKRLKRDHQAVHTFVEAIAALHEDRA